MIIGICYLEAPVKMSAANEVTTKDASLEFVVKTMEKSEVLLNQIMLFASSISNLHTAQKYLDYEVYFKGINPRENLKR